MAELYYFFLGVWEFRSNYTTNPNEYIESYDSGRDLAHILTLRFFDEENNNG